ncbi:hypothetical protein NKG94_39605 [Micromonospora sp. M12]
MRCCGWRWGGAAQPSTVRDVPQDAVPGAPARRRRGVPPLDGGEPARARPDGRHPRVIAPADPHWTARAPQVGQPVLVLMGTRDPDFPDPGAEARAARRLFRTAEARMIEGSGHYPHADQPQRTAEELLGFLAVCGA